MGEGDEKQEYIGPDGQPMSKSAWKKWQTQQKNEAKKAEKAEKVPAKPDKPDGSGEKKEEEEELDPSKYRENRIRVLEGMKDPYPHKWPVNRSIPSLVAEYEGLEPGEQVDGVEVVIGGRVLAKKEQGKLIFYDLHADGAKIQIMCPENYHK
eukprot:1461090-Amphidinium_carterae.1